MSAAFEPGDLLLAASDVDDREIDLRNHRGPGRILHLGADFSAKSVLWTGVEGLLVGLAIDPADGTIWGADPTGRRLSHLGRDGVALPVLALPERPFGTVLFDAEGTMLLGVHTRRGPPPEDEIGAANLLRREGTGWRRYELRTDGGHSGFHAVSSVALDGAVAAHLAEGGRHVYRHDLDADRPLEPLLVMPEGEGGRRVYGVAAIAGGWLVATGGGMLKLDRDGAVLADWAAPSPRGWTRVTPAKDGETFFFNNFLEGLIERRRLSDGTVVAAHDIARKCALCGVAEL